MKGEKMIKTSSFGGRMKKRLSDITNLNSQHKSPFKNQENVLPGSDNAPTKNYVDQILKENNMMVKLIEEKDKIIESNRVELQRLRLNLQRTQLQNYQLAQNNSQLIAEFNMAKDRLKTLQHEFVCKDAMFKALILEMKEEKTKPQLKPNGRDAEQKPLGDKDNKQNEVSKLVNKNNEVSKVGNKENEVSKAWDKEENKVSKVENKSLKTKRERAAKSQSMGPTMSQQAVEKEIMENKRRCLRRQSVRLRPSDKQDDLFEIDVAPNDSHRKSDSDACLSDSSKSTGSQRLSIGRPQRKAAEKVQTYKDPPLNTKMRRPS